MTYPGFIYTLQFCYRSSYKMKSLVLQIYFLGILSTFIVPTNTGTYSNKCWFFFIGISFSSQPVIANEFYEKEAESCFQLVSHVLVKKKSQTCNVSWENKSPCVNFELVKTLIYYRITNLRKELFQGL